MPPFINLNNIIKPQSPRKVFVTLFVLVWFSILMWQSVVHFPIDFKAIIALFSLSRFGPIQPDLFFAHWLNTLKNYTLLFGFGVGALGTGLSILDWLFPATRPRLEKIVLGFALGFALLSMATFFLGVLQGYHTLVYIIIYAIFAIWGGWNIWKRRAELRPASGWWWGKQPSLEDRILGIMGMFVIVGMCLAANAPELFFDALVYHLGVPEQWIVRGGIQPLPNVFFSNLVMSMEMLYTGALMLGDEKLCRLLNVSMAVMTSLTVFAIGRRWFDRRTGFWASGIFLTTPLIIFNASISGADIASGFYATVAVMVALNQTLTDEDQISSPWLVGILTGAALSCKYTSAFVLLPTWLIYFVAKRMQQSPIRNEIYTAIKMISGTMLVLAPWLIKNLIITGNPVYPFLYHFLPTRALDIGKINELMAIGWKEFGLHSWIQIIRLPWDLTFYTPTMGTYIGTVLLFLLPGYLFLGIFIKQRNIITKSLFIIVTLTLLLWVSQTRLVRFAISGIPLLVILGSVVLIKHEYSVIVNKTTARLCILILVGWGLLYSLGYSYPLWDPMGASLGLQSRELYLKQKLMTNYYPIANVINQLQKQSKIYVFGETRRYYFKRHITAPTAHDTNMLLKWLDESKSTIEIWRKLQESGHTHLYVHPQEAVRTRQFEPYRWTPDALKRWQELMAQYVKKIAYSEQQALYEILNDKNEGRPIKQEKPLFAYDPEIVNIVNPLADHALRLTNAGNWKEAERQWLKIINLAPGWNAPYVVLASMYQRQRRDSEARNMYESADRLTDLNPETYHDMGVLYWEMGKPLDAIHAMKEALRMNPGYEVAQKDLASMEQAYRLQKK